MNKAKDLVRKLGKKEESKAKEYQRASEWPKCYIAGCPLPTTIKDDNCTCTHHHKKRGFEADCITEAIKENLAFIKKYGEMIHWNVRTWREREVEIMGWPVLPATKFEMDNPSLYLNRLHAFITARINERAEEIYQGK